MRNFRYITVLLWLALMSTILPVSTSAEKVMKTSTLNVKLNFDGALLHLPEGQYVFIQNGTSYVPVRFVSYALQKDVQWNGKSKEVILSEPTDAQLTIIKEYIMNASSNVSSTSFKQKAISLTQTKVKFTYKGEKTITKEKDSFMLNGSLYVPIRLLSELVGTEISWNQKELLVTGRSQAYINQNTSVGETTQNINTSTGTKAGGNAPAESQAANGVGNGTSKLSYETIVTNTESKLNALYNQSSAALMNLASEYYVTSDSGTKAKLKAKGENLLSQFSSSFESIVQNAESQLKANGYSTDVIKQYRDKFNEEIEAGKELAKSIG